MYDMSLSVVMEDHVHTVLVKLGDFACLLCHLA